MPLTQTLLNEIEQAARIGACRPPRPPVVKCRTALAARRTAKRNLSKEGYGLVSLENTPLEWCAISGAMAPKFHRYMTDRFPQLAGKRMIHACLVKVSAGRPG